MENRRREKKEGLVESEVRGGNWGRKVLGVRYVKGGEEGWDRMKGVWGEMGDWG